MNIQLDFFENDDEISLLKKENEFLLERIDNCRRGMFKRLSIHDGAINKLLVMIEKQQEEINELRNMMLRRVK